MRLQFFFVTDLSLITARMIQNITCTGFGVDRDRDLGKCVAYPSNRYPSQNKCRKAPKFSSSSLS